MPNPFVSCRVPQKLFEDLEAHCANTGMTRTEALIRALELYLEVSSPGDRFLTVDQVLGLEEYVQQVVKQQVQLELDKINRGRANDSKKQ